LEEADRKRREEFKEYEMQKEYEKSQQLNLLDEEHKKEYEHKIEEQEKKHKIHPSVRILLFLFFKPQLTFLFSSTILAARNSWRKCGKNRIT